MKIERHIIFYFFLLIPLCLSASDDASKTIVIRNIIIEGNKKTKANTILREMTVSPSSVVLAKELNNIVSENQVNLMNLNIFKHVQLNLKNWEADSLDIEVMVFERWYFKPIPIFQLADRNFNVWWRQNNHSFKRVHYGLSLSMENFTGRADVMQVTAAFGFSQIMEVQYKIPHFSGKPKLGLKVVGHWSRTKQVPIRTINDIHEFFEEEDFNRMSVSNRTQFIFRPAIHNSHFFNLGYSLNQISKKVATINPDYFLQGRRQQQYFKLGYAFVADYRNVRAYPTDGWYLKGEIEQYGLGIFKEVQMTRLQMTMTRHNKLAKKHFTAHLFKWQLSGPQKQPYFLQEGFGYDQNFVRGFDVNVMDGQSYFLIKNSYKFRLLSYKVQNIKALRQSKLANIPLDVYLKTYFDVGYVRDRYYTAGNTLRNELNYGWGLGLDIVTFYDRVLRIEYSFNKLLENGLYLHFALPI